MTRSEYMKAYWKKNPEKYERWKKWFRKYRKASAANWEKYRKKDLETLSERKSQVLKFYYEAKNKPCMDCGIQFAPYVMQFDHRNPKDKQAGPATLAHRTTDLEKLKEELSKCDVVCANCHADRTFKQNFVGAI